MPSYNFAQVWAFREKSGKCPTCGKRTVRKFSDYQTVNPFNTNADGSVKTRDEVREAVEAVADEWVPDFEHAKCAQARTSAQTSEKEAS